LSDRGHPLKAGSRENLHVLATDGCFYGPAKARFKVCPKPKAKDLEDLFRHEVFKLLRAEGKINDAIIENMLNWRHSGFNFYCGNAIWPHNEEGLENLARYIIRASFSQERMTYIPAYESNDGIAKVLYESKDGKTSKTFDALDWPRQRTAGCKHLLSLLRTSRTRANPAEAGLLWLLLKQIEGA